LIALLRALAIGAALCLCASVPARAVSPPDSPRAAQLGAQQAAGQILVMLRLPPDHFRPNTSYGGGYGSADGMSARHRIADRLARQHGLTLLKGWPMPVLGVDCYVMAVPSSQSPSDAAAALSRDPDVAWSEPMQLYHGQGEASAPNDPLFALQPAAKTWRLADLHRIATGRNVRVAIVDSAVDTRHPDLAGQILVNRDFMPEHPGDAESHGTAVAGIIGASADNQLGVAGIAPRARLMALRACWQAPSETLCDTLSLARAISFAVENKAQVINLSLSGPPAVLLERLVDVAKARGALVVGAVDPNVAQGGFPADYAGVIAVASDGAAAAAAATRGAYFAPGRDIPTTQPHARWSLVNGSSFAAAHVTGLLALVREKDPHAMDPVHIVVARGGREIDACATLLRASGPCAECTCPTLPATGAASGR
jgi:subtilisin family serine protease